MLLIPSIDLRGGQCVRLHQGNFASETAYDIDPLALMARYRGLGASWLHVVDLDGARDGAPVNAPLVAALAAEGSLRLQVGGGVRSPKIIEGLLEAGVARVVVGSAAVHSPNEVRCWLASFGAERICLALDVRVDGDGEPRVHTHGWTRNSDVRLEAALDDYPLGAVKHVLCTDIKRDGTLAGPNLAHYGWCVRHFPWLAWQASGGIRSGADLAALAQIGVSAALSGTALLEDRIPAKELRPFWPDASSPASTCA
jgi:phosphoribosylformimino-5-aminoimidazole carboxamide ribotide isomerase